MIPRFFRIFTLLALLLPTITVAGESSVAHSEYGMVVSPERHASEIGAQILAEGGNAADATIAVAFALAVTNPQAGGLGGGGFALVRDANGEPFALDFRETAPAALRAEMFLKDDGRPDPRLSLASGLGVGVPGLPRGLETLHARWGSLPWSKLIAPAVSLAQDGFKSYPHLHSATMGSKPRLERERRARRIR